MSALVIDDDDFTRVLLVRTLESTNVGAVTQASDAASAMRLADTDGWLLDLAIRHDGEPLSDDVLPPDSRWHVGDDPRVLVARIALDS